MINMIDFTEIEKLHDMLDKADIPHSYHDLYDGKQIRVYANSSMIRELDDCIIHSGSHGVHMGLLETYALGGCEGFETAEQVFAGWQAMYNAANLDTCHCTCIGAGGEIWEGSAPSWD